MPKNTLIPQDYAGLAPPIPEQSIRFDATRATNLRGYFPGATTESDEWTMAFWIKQIDINIAHTYLHAEIDANNFTTLYKDNFNRVFFEAQIAGVVEAQFRVSDFFPIDVSNWFHFMVGFSRLTGTLQLFVNGYPWTQFDFFTSPTNIPGYAWLDSTAEHFVGADLAGTRHFSGMMADLHVIGGTRLGVSVGNFGNFDANGTFMRAAFPGPWGTHGFNLSFGRTVDLGEDFSGNANDFPTHTNGGSTDQFDDWTERNYAIADRNDHRSLGLITEGGLVVGTLDCRSTLHPPANSGVYYYERNGVAVTWDTGVSGEFDPVLTPATYNFGQLPFVDVGPMGGELTVVSPNLPAALIPNCRDNFHAIGYTGNGVNPRTIITGTRGDAEHRNLTHRSDLVWVKNMSSGAFGHYLMNRLRPAGQLPINTTGPEEATNVNGFITALLDPGPGFSVDAGGTSDDNVNNSGGTFYSAVSWQVEQYGQNIRVAIDDDDAEEVVSSGDTDIGSSDLEIVLEGGSVEQEIGLRFLDVRIPQGATIIDARVQFEADVTNTGTCDTLIFCQDADNAPTFVGGAANFNISGRATTGSGVAWSPPDWNVVQERGAPQLTTNFASQLQGVVDRGGWTEGNAVVVIIKGDPGGTLGEREAEAFDGTQPPELQVSWRLATPVSSVSLFSYEGLGIARDVMHGLAVAPEMIALKRRDAAADWSVYLASVVTAGNPEDGRLAFNNNAAWTAGADWDNTAPGATFFRVGTPARVNALAGEYAGMAVASVEGFSKVFRYIGNGSSNGPQIYCGFKPRLILIKGTSAATDWVFHHRASGASDSIESIFNQMDGNMYLNTFANAAQLDSMNVYSQSFQLRGNDPSTNTNLQEYVGVAFAEAAVQNAKAAT